MQSRSIRRSGQPTMCQRIIECELLTGTRSAEGIMASGHVKPHRQAEHMAATDQLHREENPCQPGAVHTWHCSDLPASLRCGRYRGKSGPCARRAYWPDL